MHVCAFACGQGIAMHELCSNAPVRESFCHRPFSAKQEARATGWYRLKKRLLFFNVYSLFSGGGVQKTADNGSWHGTQTQAITQRER